MNDDMNSIYSSTITGVGGTSIGNYTVSYPSTTPNTTYTIGPSNWTNAITASNSSEGLVVNGDAKFEGDILIKGKSLSDRLDGIEKRLAILHPNKKLEEKWERLKSLGDMYRELEKEIIEKEHIWAKLKK